MFLKLLTENIAIVLRDLFITLHCESTKKKKVNDKRESY